MAVPKHKLSRSKTRHRRANWKAEPAELVTITVDGQQVRIPRRLAQAVRGLRAPG